MNSNQKFIESFKGQQPTKAKPQFLKLPEDDIEIRPLRSIPDSKIIAMIDDLLLWRQTS